MPRLIAPTLAGALIGSLLTGCPDREVTELIPEQDNVLTKTVPVNLNRNLDLIFVIDNSGSMAAEQAALATNFPRFIQVLETIPGGLPDLHLGVLSSDMGAGGVSGIGCSNSDDGNFRVGFPPRDVSLPGYRDCKQLFGMQADYFSDIGMTGTTNRTRNYTGALGDAFTCAATLGVTGCGFEQHLESAWRSLQTGKNPGFYRPEAFLAVIFLADEDDCSTENAAMFGEANGNNTTPLGYRSSFRCHEFGVTCDGDSNPRAFGQKVGCEAQADSAYLWDINKYVTFFRGLKPDPKMVITAGIIGTFDSVMGELTVGQDPDPNAAQGQPAVQRSCGFNPADQHAGASPPVRLMKFLSQFPERNTVTSICDADLSGALVQIGQLLKLAIGDPCVDAQLADRNPDLDGIQYECTVVDVQNPDTANEIETVIPECPPGASEPIPCWHLVPDAMECPDAPGNFKIKVERGGASAPLGTVMEMQCVTI